MVQRLGDNKATPHTMVYIDLYLLSKMQGGLTMDLPLVLWTDGSMLAHWHVLKKYLERGNLLYVSVLGDVPWVSLLHDVEYF